MKKNILLITALVFISISLMAQTVERKRIRDLDSETTFTGQEFFIIDRADYPSGKFKKMSADQVISLVLSQGGSSTTLGALTDIDFTNETANYKLTTNGAGSYFWSVDESGAAGASDHKFILNVSDPTPGYWDDKISSGNFIQFDSDGETISIDGLVASAAEVSGMQNIDRLLQPNNMPIVRLFGAAVNNNAQTLFYKGLGLKRYWNGNQIEWQIFTDYYTLPEALDPDPWALYFAVDNDGDSEKVGFFKVVDLINAAQYEIYVVPDWYQAHFSLAGEDYVSCISCALRTGIQIYKNGVLQSVSATNFSHENDVGLTSASFASVFNTISLSGSYPAGTYDCDGSVIWSTDIVYTDPTNGVKVRKTVGFRNPITNPCGGQGNPGGVDQGVYMVELVDSWPVTATQGVFLKMDEEARFYYIDSGLCQWGYIKLDGSGGLCLVAKQE